MELTIAIPDLYIGIGIGIILSVVAWFITFIIGLANGIH